MPPFLKLPKTHVLSVSLLVGAVVFIAILFTFHSNVPQFNRVAESTPSSISHIPEHDTACNEWSTDILLRPSARTKVTHDTDASTGICTTHWSHRGYPRRYEHGRVNAIIQRPLGTLCVPRRDATTEELEGHVRESALCLRTGSDDTETVVEGSTVVIRMGNDKIDRWVDFMSASSHGLNLWHVHAVIFRLWVMSQLPLTLGLPSKNVSVLPPLAIALVVPVVAWQNALMPRNDAALPITVDTLSALLRQNVSPAAVEALQGTHDAFHGRLVLANEKTTLRSLTDALRSVGLSPNISAWVDPPPTDGLLWDLAHDHEIAKTVGQNCKHSVISHYANVLLSSVPITHKSKVARHICFISRQTRSRTSTIHNVRGNLRNLRQDFAVRLLQRLGSAIFVAPETSLREMDNDGLPLQLSHSSLTGQLRFIHEECAVLLGVHGAGLTNVLGLRPGTSIVEIQAETTTYPYFKNLAALSTNIDYTVVKALGSGQNGEVDMFMTNEELDLLVKLVEQKLHDSLRQQLQ